MKLETKIYGFPLGSKEACKKPSTKQPKIFLHIPDKSKTSILEKVGGQPKY